MYKIISDNHRVNYGCIDEPIEWNYEDSKIRNVFDKEITGFWKRRAYHQFNYLGIINEQYAIGIGVVDLSLGYNVFALCYEFGKGMIFKSDEILIRKFGKFRFDRNPENFIVEFKSGKTSLTILHSKEKGEIEIYANFSKKIILNASATFSLANNPLRVLNPSLPTRWTFTEKMAGLKFSSLDVCINGEPKNFSKSKTYLCYDWTGGYLRRNTNWYWSMFAGKSEEGAQVGANFAALVNESFYPENAIWIDGKRFRFDRILFLFDYANQFDPWEILTEDKKINLIFTPEGLLKKQSSAGPFIKSNFKQYLGHYSGTIKVDKKCYTLKDIPGFAEIQKARW